MFKKLCLGSWIVVGLFGCSAADPSDSSDGDEEIDTSSDAAVCAAGSTIRGVDVSYYQGTVNWSSAKQSGIDFAFARVSDGTGFNDTQFYNNWNNMKAAGVVRGSYQFFRPAQDPIAQADLLVSKIQQAGGFASGDLAPALDIEVTDGVASSTILSRMQQWLSRVQQSTGRTPIIYTSPGFWSQLGNPSGFSQYTLWVAHWNVTCPNVPSGSWTNWKFWQYGDNGTVPGISGAVDVDRFNGTLIDLKAFAGGGTGLPSLGGSVQSNPILGRNADGRLEVFAIQTGGGPMVTTFQTAANGGWSDGWYSLGGNLTGTPAVGTNQDGRLEVFARGADHAVWHASQGAANGSIGAFTSLSGYVNADPVVARNSDGRLEVFVNGTDGYLYHTYQTTPGGSWVAWAGLGSLISGGVSYPWVIADGNGRLVVVVRGTTDQVTYVIRQTASGWSGWTSLGGVIEGAPTIGRNLDGRLEVFARGTNGQLYHQYEGSVNGAWSGWVSLGGGIYDPVAASDADGRIEVFVRGTNSSLYRIAQVSPNAGWGGFVQMPSTFVGAPGAANNADGRLEVFVRGSDGSVGHRWQSSPGVW